MGNATLPPIWKCFACGKQGVGNLGAAVRWVIEYHGLSYSDALHYLKINKADRDRSLQEPPIQRPDNPPSEIWQARAMQLIGRAEAALWDGRGTEVLAWLYARGLNDSMIRKARLGYIATYFQQPARAWGTPNDDPDPMEFPQGLLIPGIIDSVMWYLKIRPTRPRKDQKYKQVRGSKQALYLADTLIADFPAIFCEGEFDALLLKQEVGDLASVITLGGASNEINLATWGLYLLRPSSFILAHDMDEAGNKAAQKMAWLHNSTRLQIPALNQGDKDLTDFYKSGGDLRTLIHDAIKPEAQPAANP